MIAESFLVIRQTLAAVLGWIIGYPLTRMIKRDTSLTIVLGRPGRVFADNSKYFFIYATELIRGGERVVMLTGNHDIQELICDAGGESVFHPSWRSFWLLLRCGAVVTDVEWFEYGLYPLTCGAKRVQIWHGAPLKHIELDVYERRLGRMPIWLKLLLRIQKAVTGRYPDYDVVVATSQGFITDAFQSCFKAKKFIASGYPRNDILFGWPDPGSVAYPLSWVNVDKQTMEAVAEARNSGQFIVLFVPTFRKNMDDPFEAEIDLTRLSTFAQRHNLLVVLKLHPAMNGHYRISQYPNLIEYAPLGDVYPLMALCDILITDYSSIFFDFLLLDRPILFFAYDLKQYLSQDRNMYFDYDAITPGAKCHNYNELELQLEEVIKNGCTDQYGEMRMKVRSYTHDNKDNQAGRRLIERHLRG